MANSEYEYVKREFEFDRRLPPSNWIVVRIDGCHFHRFSKIHAFEKPNDKNALRLMNDCATAMLEKFPDIVFAYGVSDEYSFVFREETEFYHRREGKILSLCVSYFTSLYVMKWKGFFPNKELKEPPYFDARAVCYPNLKTIRDYLAWRQVDCKLLKLKSQLSCNTVTSLVVATPGSAMVFPHNEAVATATHKPKRVKKGAKKKGPPPASTSRSATGSNDPFPPQIEQPPSVHEDIASFERSRQTVPSPRKKQAVMKKYSPRRAPVEVANPSSPASNTRSKKKLQLE